MNYVGIDIHKKYSVLCAQDEQGYSGSGSRLNNLTFLPLPTASSPKATITPERLGEEVSGSFAAA